ncbi:hypothetical protein J2T57_001670 [Natronocella acetinitrilica]|uniref:Uncharacterized protein n=1 Tax=Natronocella acetinitrilica TaxID=414046 RepID=A0AAE3KC63_9GAMM|nr:hypothetical protein [Natronocella acetinitrilica]MCP1674568.1 hypothetical protein [Natronocella acetinitrilica]
MTALDELTTLAAPARARLIGFRQAQRASRLVCALIPAGCLAMAAVGILERHGLLGMLWVLPLGLLLLTTALGFKGLRALETLTVRRGSAAASELLWMSGVFLAVGVLFAAAPWFAGTDGLLRAVKILGLGAVLTLIHSNLIALRERRLPRVLAAFARVEQGARARLSLIELILADSLRDIEQGGMIASLRGHNKLWALEQWQRAPRLNADQRLRAAQWAGEARERNMVVGEPSAAVRAVAARWLEDHPRQV